VPKPEEEGILLFQGETGDEVERVLPDDLLDRLAARVGARRWLVCWRDEQGWMTHRREALGRDELLILLADDLAASSTRAVETSDLGDTGLRLAAAGVHRLLVLSPGSLDGGLVLFLEDPDPDRAESFVGGPGAREIDLLAAGLRRGLAAARWAEELFLVRDWAPALTEMGRGGDETVGLQWLGQRSGHSAVVALVAVRRGVLVLAASRTGGLWQRSQATLTEDTLDRARSDPLAALADAARRAGVESPGAWSVGMTSGEEPTVVLGLAGGQERPSAQGMDILASLLGRALGRRDTALAARHNTLLEERARIASLIHEGLTQVLTNVAIQLELLDQVLDHPEQARVTVRGARGAVLESLDALRGAIFELAPAASEWTDLAEGLGRYVADYGSQWGLDLAYEVEGEAREVGGEVLTLTYAFVQEGLTNVRKHAGTDRADVRLRFEPGWISVSVRDEGKGLEVGSSGGHGLREHQGLSIARSRVRLMGGRLNVRAAPGRGTTLTMEVPL
jgi:signal transduction histidine kinase